ncbi:MAG: c-type cytochrome, partial [Rhodobacteraceae bacterium]|nr:c-type cytochrome [Paracoccaceae bacterium]
MKTSLWGALALAVLAAAPAAAQDAAAGERVFSQCMACHQITDAAGTVIRRGGAVGPNLYGVAGRAAAAAEGFR